MVCAYNVPCCWMPQHCAPYVSADTGLLLRILVNCIMWLRLPAVAGACQLHHVRVQLVAGLAMVPGHLMITDSFLYFASFYDVQSMPGYRYHSTVCVVVNTVYCAGTALSTVYGTAL